MDNIIFPGLLYSSAISADATDAAMNLEDKTFLTFAALSFTQVGAPVL